MLGILLKSFKFYKMNKKDLLHNNVTYSVINLQERSVFLFILIDYEKIIICEKYKSKSI